MAVNLVTVTGNLETLIGSTPTSAAIWFKINRPGWNADGDIFVPEYVSAAPDANGAFTVNLQSTASMVTGSVYTAIVRYRDAVTSLQKEFTLGSFTLDNGGPFQLGDLLGVVTTLPDELRTFPSRAAFVSARINDEVLNPSYIQDGVELSFYQDQSEVNPAAVTLDGKKWSPAQPASVLHWGVAMNDRAAAASNATAINAANAWCTARKQELAIPAGIIFFGSRLNMTTTWVGQGGGFWPVQPAVSRPAAEKAIVPAQTQLVAVGTFARDLTCPGISSMDCSGASRVNPSARGAGHNDTKYKLLSFMNDDGTVKGFSAAIYATGYGLQSRNFRVLPDFGGVDGQDGYEDSTASGRSTADVDIGILLEDVPSLHLAEVSAVGHWRMAGGCLLQIKMDETSAITGTTYNARFGKCHFQGFHGFTHRGSDTYKIISSSGNKVTIPWADDMAIRSSRVWARARWNSTGGFSGSSLPAAITGVAKVGDNCEITFASSVSATLLPGYTIIARGIGGGDSQTVMDECKFQGFTFSNGGMAHNGNVVATPFDAPSCAYSKSGWRGTETMINYALFHHIEEVFFHIHDADYVTIENPQFEKTVDIGAGTNRARLISSANVTTHHPYPSGFVFRLDMNANQAVSLTGLDLGPNIPVSRASTFPLDNGFLEATQLTIPDYQGSDQYYGAHLVPFVGQTAGIKKPGHPFVADAFVYNSANGYLQKTAPMIDMEKTYISSITVSGGGSVLYQCGNDCNLRIPDDAVATITLSNVAFNVFGYAVGNALLRRAGMFAGRAASTPYCLILGGANVLGSTTVLTGTTGTDGNLNISFTEGVVYIENRTGGQADYHVGLMTQ